MPPVKDKYSERSGYNLERASSGTLERMIKTTDSMLTTLVTMSTALLAIGVIFDDFVKSPLLRALIILLFFVGLILSFLGVLPFRVRYDLEDAQEVKEQQITIFRRKRRHLWMSAGATALGFVLIIADLMVDVFNNIA